jgi:leucyl-tRNA synthetase
VTEAIERLSFNTAIAGTMEFVNALYLVQKPDAAAIKEAVTTLARLLSPFAPHIADEICESYGATTMLIDQAWPPYDAALVVDDVKTYGIQVNGKLRGEITVPIAAGETEVRAAAEADEKVKAAIAGKTVRKFVFVPGKVVNFVVG